MKSVKKVKPDFYRIFSKFTTDKIEAINILASICSGTGSSVDLGERLHKTNQALGGTFSSLSRTKINGIPLVVPLAKDPEKGTIWKLNIDVAPREEIKETTDNILSEVKKWEKDQ